MRHAKSSWAEPGLTDFQRPLNRRGFRVAPQVAEFIHLQGLTPNAIISSSAARAATTAKIFAERCEGVTLEQVNLIEDLYLARAEVYLEYLQHYADETAQTLMFVGHNPGLEHLVEQLSGRWEIMPTAAVAHFDLEVDRWSDLAPPIHGKLKNLWRPKEINIE